MKTLLQVVLPLVILVAGVGGFTFMSQYTRKPPVVVDRGPADKSKGGTKPTVALKVPVKTAQWDEADDKYVAAFEKGAPGQYIFWLMNPNPKPVSAHLSYKSCTCAE